MSELLKDNLSYGKVLVLAHRISEQIDIVKLESKKSIKINFDLKEFEENLIKFCHCEGKNCWTDLSLMQRMRVSAKALYLLMPEVEGSKVVVSTLHKNKQLSGWLSLICCEYISINENLTIEQALTDLKDITEYFSAEFAIRHVLLRNPSESLAILNSWLADENEHVRRLISEGTRPRLPWGIRLSIFIQNPEWVLPLLKSLRDDLSEYVRRSVANHLNDLSKDHPELIITIAQDWLSDVELEKLNKSQRLYRVKLIRHACRTLFKQGEPRIMALFGYHPADDIRCTLTSSNITVPFDGVFEFNVLIERMGLESESSYNNKLMVDYVMHFQKANGKQAPKVFKWLDRNFIDNSSERGDASIFETVTKRHSFKKITTRKYYPGIHTIEIMVNGVKKAQLEFELLKP